MFIDKFSGIDLIKFSIKPPPVICAAELIKFFSQSFKISLEYILVGLSNNLFNFSTYTFFFKIVLTSEYPFE